MARARPSRRSVQNTGPVRTCRPLRVHFSWLRRRPMSALAPHHGPWPHRPAPVVPALPPSPSLSSSSFPRSLELIVAAALITAAKSAQWPLAAAARILFLGSAPGGDVERQTHVPKSRRGSGNRTPGRSVTAPVTQRRGDGRADNGIAHRLRKYSTAERKCNGRPATGRAAGCGRGWSSAGSASTPRGLSGTSLPAAICA